MAETRTERGPSLAPIDGVVPHPPEAAARWRERGYWRDESLADHFGGLFERYADRVAVTDDRRSATYRQLGETAERLAANLYGLGLRPRDRVVVQLPTALEFVELYLAMQRLGVIPVAALPAHRHREIDHFVATTDAAAIVAPAEHRGFDHAELLLRIAAERPSVRSSIVLGADPDQLAAGLTSFEELVDRTPDPSWVAAVADVRIDPDDPAVFQLSGGTTGIPKLIPRTHNDYRYNSQLAASVCDIGSDDVLLLALPIAHNLPLACPGLQGFLQAGAHVVLSSSARADDVLPLIQRHAATHLHVVPALLISWVNSPEAATCDLRSVRVIQSGGQRLQPEVRARAETAFPRSTVQENFGMAEGLLLFVRLDDPPEVRRETCGRPICPDDEIRLVDEDGVDVPPGEVGEMICRGPYTLRGYFRAEEHNRRAFTDDGFYRSGDLMRLHPSGNYVVEGRRKDLINRGGEKISAEEVENLILSHPAVVNVACVPLPDARLGERMCACVVLAGTATLTLEELCNFLGRYEIARFKLPERIEVFEELPLSSFGKVSKKQLVADLAGT